MASLRLLSMVVSSAGSGKINVDDIVDNVSQRDR